MIPLPKVFTCAGKTITLTTHDYFMILIGTLGSCISLFGLFQACPQYYYIGGSTLILIVSIYYKLFYFIALQVIMISGHTAILLGLGPILQFAIPCFLCFQLLFFYYFTEPLTRFTLVGILGIAILSIGFSYEGNWVFFVGSAMISLYSLHLAQKNSIAYLWAVLNSLFASITAIEFISTFI